MSGFMGQLLHSLVLSGRNLFPVVLLVMVFHGLILRRPFDGKVRLGLGLGFCLVGLGLFLMGLELVLFPMGKKMARELVTFTLATAVGDAGKLAWWDCGWIYLFGGLIGFATTMAEPALIAVALKAEEVSRGSIRQGGLRIAVALGVGLGIVVGLFRIVTGTPLVLYITAGYVIVVLQTLKAPRYIIPLAYDSGGVTTSMVTVPIVTALGLGVAGMLPGRNPMLDGFGLVAFASLFPIITVMGYIQVAEWWTRRRSRQESEEIGEKRQMDNVS